MNDPIINEIRKFRDEHSKAFNYDLDAICNDYKAKHNLYVKKLKEISDKKLLTKECS